MQGKSAKIDNQCCYHMCCTGLETATLWLPGEHSTTELNLCSVRDRIHTGFILFVVTHLSNICYCIVDKKRHGSNFIALFQNPRFSRQIYWEYQMIFTLNNSHKFTKNIYWKYIEYYRKLKCENVVSDLVKIYAGEHLTISSLCLELVWHPIYSLMLLLY
jgi:hypothetical protein